MAGCALTSGIAISPVGDLLMLVAIVVCGFGYAEGTGLSRALGGWQVISWALVRVLPAMGLLVVVTRPLSFAGMAFPSWLGFAYVSLFSMLIGFVFWYRGLARGGIAGVGQLHVLQPYFGLALAAVWLHERVRPLVSAVTVAVVLCVAGARRFAR